MESEKGRMTELKQLERDARNINGLNEHGSYCECIWCLEEQMRNGTTAYGVQWEMEQEMTAMLKDLPLSIAITRQDDLSNAGYTWRYLGTEGKANSFVDAVQQALQSLIGVSVMARI
jgi:hypothetical protein